MLGSSMVILDGNFSKKDRFYISGFFILYLLVQLTLSKHRVSILTLKLMLEMSMLKFYNF